MRYPYGLCNFFLHLVLFVLSLSHTYSLIMCLLLCRVFFFTLYLLPFLLFFFFSFFSFRAMM